MNMLVEENLKSSFLTQILFLYERGEMMLCVNAVNRLGVVGPCSVYIYLF